MNRFFKQKVTAISFLLLICIFQNYLCSVSCSLNIFNCCSSSAEIPACCRHLQKQPVANQEKQDQDCQQYHDHFFSAIGQFHSSSKQSLKDVFQFLIAIAVPSPVMITESGFSNAYSMDRLRPPDPESDLLVLFRTFRI